MDINKFIKTKWKDLKHFTKQSKRVLKVSTKPDRKEYLTVAKVTLIGIVVIGVIAYIIRSISTILGGA